MTSSPGKVVKTTTFGAFVELSQGHRRPAAHLATSPRASASTRSRRFSTVVTRSRSRSSRSTASADESACGSPTTRRSPASRRRSSPPSSPREATAEAIAGIAARAVTATAVEIAASVAQAVPVTAAPTATLTGSWRRSTASPHSSRVCGSSPRRCPRCDPPHSGSSSARARPPRTRPSPGGRTCSSTCCSAGRRATARSRSTRSSTRWAPT